MIARTFIAAALAALTSACATALAPVAPLVAAPSPTLGRLYHFQRTNQDGSEPEDIYVYRASATRVEVHKVVSRCANAAYVTAELDLERRQPRALVGGRVATDGSQEAFAWLDYDPATREINARAPPANIDTRIAVGAEPWSIYDFDLADITTLHAGRPAARADFSFWSLVIWPPDMATNPFRTLGQTHARFAAAEAHLGRETLRYDVSGGLNGQLWLDAREGHVVEARFAEPNHAEYHDFRLALRSVRDDAETEWRALLAAHWANCP